jgi:hypothetical protein
MAVMMKAITISVCALCGLSSLAGCGSAEEPLAYYQVYGTASTTESDVSGHWAYFRIVEADAGMSADVLYRARCQMVGPSCDYQFTQVAEGLYTMYGIIDRNGNANWADPMPDTGDLISPGRPLTLMGGQRLDFPDEAWHAMF